MRFSCRASPCAPHVLLQVLYAESAACPAFPASNSVACGAIAEAVGCVVQHLVTSHQRRLLWRRCLAECRCQRECNSCGLFSIVPQAQPGVSGGQFSLAGLLEQFDGEGSLDAHCVGFPLRSIHSLRLATSVLFRLVFQLSSPKRFVTYFASCACSALQCAGLPARTSFRLARFEVGKMSNLGTTAPSRVMIQHNPDGAQSVRPHRSARFQACALRPPPCCAGPSNALPPSSAWPWRCLSPCPLFRFAPILRSAPLLRLSANPWRKTQRRPRLAPPSCV